MNKEERVLEVWQSDGQKLTKIREYQADIGKRVADKQREGDHATPEGLYFLQERKKAGPKIPFSLYGSQAFTTDYPNYFDRLIGKTGSGIWIHAVPNSTPLSRGSRGCVVIRDYAIKELAPFFKPRMTPVVIDRQATYVSEPERIAQRDAVRNFIAKWLNDWQNEPVSTYIRHYDPLFRGQNMGRDAWYKHKYNLKNFYKYIRLSITEPLIINRGNHYVVRFLQNYESDRFNDFGEKTLYLVRKKGNFKIIGEDWYTVNEDIAVQELLTQPFALFSESPNALAYQKPT